jgi:hypothetical protein
MEARLRLAARVEPADRRAHMHRPASTIRQIRTRVAVRLSVKGMRYRESFFIEHADVEHGGCLRSELNDSIVLCAYRRRRIGRRELAGGAA